jgi:predicted nucleic acid-binding protein
MSAETPACFLDTNVLVYAFEKGDTSKKQVARQLLRRLTNTGSLCLSTQVLQELFVTLTRKAARPSTTEEATTILDNLAQWPVIVIDYPAIRAAADLSKRARLSFWDALVVVAASCSGASVLYTEDLNDGQEILGVRITNPFLES